MSWDDVHVALGRLETRPRPDDAYLGFYSSWLGGYFREPWAMLMPFDDHGFHRGDAVFEAARIFERALIDFDAHLERLEASAAAIELALPKSTAEIGEICKELCRRTRADHGVLRLFVSRGPGSFGPGPAESEGAQIYAAITALKAPSAELYHRGARACVSSVLPKEPRWSRIKSCNYLSNVMMKHEALARGFDFALGVDPLGRVGEGATENFVIVNQARELLVPKFEYTLRGTTVRTAMSLATNLVTEVRFADLAVDDVYQAREAAFIGTTLGVMPVSSLDERPIGHGHAGPIMGALHQRLLAAWGTQSGLRTEF